jgi:hypothetical protein
VSNNCCRAATLSEFSPQWTLAKKTPSGSSKARGAPSHNV